MNPNIRWPDNTLPVGIHCASGVLTGLEVAATDGLLALPRIGLGIGGLLVGRRLDRAVEIARYVEIDCSHAAGPAFVLTPAELAAALPAIDSDSNVVGWYCSKTQGPMDLTEHDIALFDAFCPEPWQVVLLIRPSKTKVTSALFGLRTGTAFLMGAPRDLAWQELAAFEVPPPPVSVPIPAPTAIEEHPVAPAIVEEPTDIPLRGGTLFGVPDAPPPARKPRRWLKPLLITAVLLALLGAAAFFSRDYWLPKPPVALAASSDWRGLISVIWNAEALGRENTATLVIDDGSGPLHTIHLNPAGMRGGWYQLDCRPGRVIVTLLSGDLTDTITLTARTQTYLPESGISKK